jgi:hypothetical protein
MLSGSEPPDGERPSTPYATQSGLDNQIREGSVRSQLPTPSQSTSPEPNIQVSAVKDEPPLSPTINRTPLLAVMPDTFGVKEHKEHGRQLGSAGGSSTHLPSPVSPCFPEDLPAFLRRSTKTHPHSQVTPLPLQNIISPRFPSPLTINQLAEHSSAPRSNRPPSVPSVWKSRLSESLIPPGSIAPVRNAAAFNKAIRPHETKMQNFLNQVADGALRQAGWDPRHAKQPDANTLPTPTFTRHKT